MDAEGGRQTLPMRWKGAALELPNVTMFGVRRGAGLVLLCFLVITAHAAVAQLLLPSSFVSSDRVQVPRIALQDLEDLPDHFVALSDAELGIEETRERVTVDGAPCSLPIRVGDDQWANDCVPWWDGQEWCVVEEEDGEGSWHVCQRGWSTPHDRRIGGRTMQQVTVGNLLDSLRLPSEEESPAQPEPEPKPEFVLPERDEPTLSGPVVITEFMASNKRTFLDPSDGSYPDWIEIHNESPEEVDLGGWRLTNDRDAPEKWTFPRGTVLGPMKYLLVLASGAEGAAESQAEEAEGLALAPGELLRTSFKLDSKGGYLALLSPAGSVASEYDYPPQLEDVSFGRAEGQLLDFMSRARGGGSEAGEGEKKQIWFLMTPTPRMRNSNKRMMGPVLRRVTENPEARPEAGEDFAINATVYLESGASSLPSVTLFYKTGYMADTMIEMKPTGDMDDAGGVVYSAKIPGVVLVPGGMVRWYVTARQGAKSLSTTRAPRVKAVGYPQYYGTVVNSRNEGKTNLPMMHFFSANEYNAMSQNGGVAQVFYDGRFYDNVKTRRRGQTTITWEKPKLKLDFKGKVFKFADGEKKVEEFNLQSHYFELGSQTYMREDLGSQVLLEAGVPTPIVFPLDLWVNGRFYGLYSFVEQIDDSFLKRNDLPKGPLYKAWHQWKSNLRWDIETDKMQWAYRKGNMKDVEVLSDQLGSYDDLKNFTLGLVGKGTTWDSWKRSTYLFQHVNIPEAINEMAAQNLVLNQDRLTKNYYVYHDPETSEWAKLPWDLEAAFGLSPKLGGEASQFYCVLECEQFNSPLYGDSEHPQDIRDFFDGSRWNRRLQFLYVPPPYYGYPPPYQHHSHKEQEWTCENPGEEGTGCFGKEGPRYADGTFNYLSDALLDVSETREMYLRRLRTLMDQFMNGKLEQMVTRHYELIRPSAKLDNQVWKRGDIDEGYEQLLTEQLPQRREQLYDTYGPRGEGLIPGAQKKDPRAGISAFPREGLLVVANEESEAVDISGWRVKGDAKFEFKPGTVIPSKSKVVVCADVLACKASGRFAKARVMKLGPYKGALKEQGEGIELLDSGGRVLSKV